MSELDDESEFAEPEETPRPSPWRYGWLLGAMVLGLAGWQWSEAIVRPAGVLAMSSSLVPPPQLHSHDRSSADRASANEKDPVARYLAAAGRGMTDQEIRRIVEDYDQRINALLPKNAESFLTIDQALQLRRAQQEWYVEVLAEALSLTQSQQAQAHAHLRDLLRQDERVLRALSRPLSPQELDEKRYFGMHRWMTYEACAPWNLCDLSPQQEALTAKAIFDEWKRKPENDLSIPWCSGAALMLKQNDGGGYFTTQETPLFFYGIGLFTFQILPLTEQQLQEPLDVTSTTTQQSHPAQLRMDLLLQSHSGRQATDLYDRFCSQESPQQNGGMMESQTGKVEE